MDGACSGEQGGVENGDPAQATLLAVVADPIMCGAVDDDESSLFMVTNAHPERHSILLPPHVQQE